MRNAYLTGQPESGNHGFVRLLIDTSDVIHTFHLPSPTCISTTIHQKGLRRHNSEKLNCSGGTKNCFHIKILGLRL